MAEQYNQRKHMEEVHDSGGSVYYKGQIIPPGAKLPTEAELAQGDPARVAAARAAIAARRAALDAEEAMLSAPGGGQARGNDEDALPEDFPARAALSEAGYTSRSQIADLSDEDLTAIKGVGPATAARIREALEA